jgi:hypothetical protein
MAQSVLLWIAVVAVFFIALFGIGVLLRLSRVLRALEEALIAATEEMRETLPEVREGLGNVNDIAAGVTLALKVTGSGAQRFGGSARLKLRRLGWGLQAAVYGVRTGAGSLASAYDELADPTLEQKGGAAGGD